MAKLFVSYAHEDVVFAENVKLSLERFSHEVWIDHEGLHAGVDWGRGIDDAIQAADVLLLIVSEDAMDSKYVTYEWSYALGASVPIIPLLYKQIDEGYLHPRLAKIQYVDMSHRRYWDELNREIKQLARQNKSAHYELDRLPGGYETQSTDINVGSTTADGVTATLPTRPTCYQLTVVAGPEAGKSFTLTNQLYRLGREPDNDIVIGERTISRYHLHLLRSDDTYGILDLNSSNGTTVDGFRVTNLKLLHHNAKITVGGVVVLHFKVTDLN